MACLKRSDSGICGHTNEPCPFRKELINLSGDIHICGEIRMRLRKEKGRKVG